MKQKLFYLNGFEFKWMKRKGFYRLIWFAVLSKFGIITTNARQFNGGFFSIGSKVPLSDLCEKGLKYWFAGWVINEPVIFYDK